MPWPFRDRSDAIAGKLEQLVTLLEANREGARPESVMRLEGRLEELERSRALWEAEMEGLVAKAIQERKHARNAEERTRHLSKRLTGKGSAFGDEEGEEELPPEYLAAISGRDANGGSAEGLPTMRDGVGTSREARKAAAQRYKFGH